MQHVCGRKADLDSASLSKRLEILVSVIDSNNSDKISKKKLKHILS